MVCTRKAGKPSARPMTKQPAMASGSPIQKLMPAFIRMATV